MPVSVKASVLQVNDVELSEIHPENRVVKDRSKRETINPPKNRNDGNNKDNGTQQENQSVNALLLPSFPTKNDWKEAWPGESPTLESLHFFLTTETFKMALNIFKLGSLVKCVPFELAQIEAEGPSLRARPFRPWWQRMLWHLVSWLMFGMAAFQYVSFYLLWQREKFGSDMAYHIVYGLWGAWFLVYFLPLYRHPEKCILMLNQHDYVAKHSKRLGFGLKHWASHHLVILAVYYLSWALMGLSTVGNIILFNIFLGNEKQFK